MLVCRRIIELSGEESSFEYNPENANAKNIMIKFLHLQIAQN
jgi:hypothetical protein